MSNVTIQSLLNDVQHIQRAGLPYVMETAALADNSDELKQSVIDTETTIDDTACLLKSLTRELSLTLVNVNDMQAAALFLGCEPLLISNSVPVNAIESTFNALAKKTFTSASRIEVTETASIDWDTISQQIKRELGCF